MTFWKLPERLERRRQFLLKANRVPPARPKLLEQKIETKDIDANLALVRSSPVFDAGFYAARAGLAADLDPALHYIERGERLGLPASSEFNARLYAAANPDVAQTSINRLIHYELHGRAEGRPLQPTEEASEDDLLAADVVRASVHFDPVFYVSQIPADELVGDLALHYVKYGEARDLLPSADFDPARYKSRNKDVAYAGANALVHFEQHGRAEGRPLPTAARAMVYPTEALSKDKKTVLILLHEASYTGAPILGWNLAKRLSERWNVVVVLGRGGPLFEAFEGFDVVGPLENILGDPIEMEAVAKGLKDTYQPEFVVANSVDTQPIAVALIDQDVPTIILVHEFSSHALPLGRLDPMLRKANEVVFPAELVRDSAIGTYPYLQLRDTRVLAQGLSDIPRLGKAPSAHPSEVSMSLVPSDRAPMTLKQAFAVGMEKRPFIVVGLGSLDLRKGVDLFIAAATNLLHRHPERDFRFIWVGESKHVMGSPYGIGLQEQISRSGLNERFALIPALDDLSLVYENADAMFLSSRLDPLPNVAVEAALKSIPVVCFDRGTGLAEILQSQPGTSALVVPYMDVGRAADALSALMSDSVHYRKTASAIGRLAQKKFDFNRYAKQIEALGMAAAEAAPAERMRRRKDIALLIQDGGLDPEFVFGPKSVEIFGVPASDVAREDAAEYFLRFNERIRLGLPAVRHYSPPRTRPGFNPLSYAHHFEGFERDSLRDPLAHYIESGSPEGPWTHPLIELHASARLRIPPVQRLALHGHFHYTDNIGDLLHGLQANKSDVDLFLTTTSTEAADELHRATRDYAGGSVVIEVGENRGRDIGPFLRVLSDHIIGRYDIVGHLHGKRSVHTHHFDAQLGDRWRIFLWEHLLGPGLPALDIIMERMAVDARLGLVFPENAFLVGWELDRALAGSLAARMGISALPDEIEFPIGTMFWARTEALAPLLKLGLTDADYPDEPLPVDGTVLHALERLLTTVVEHGGYRYATTYTPSVKR